MRHRKILVSLGAVGASALSLLLATPAHADYAPSAGDVVGVGSDTLQYIGDFIADGDHLGDTGYNALGNLNHVINFDATPDANARVAYGPTGITATTTNNCTPGTGKIAGTANQTGKHSDAAACFLNPTIVLRAGLNPVLRPNGSGAGYDALLRDSNHYIDYSRSSTCQGGSSGCRGKSVTGMDSIQVGNDPFNIWVADTTNAVPLSAPQLKSIYEANTGSCKTWADVGSTGTNASHTIIPIVPQVDSGTFSSFASSIGMATTALGTCAVQFEENDPTAIYQVATPADAIEPISGGRMNLFQGKLGNGTSTGQPGYFRDPSCPVESTTPAQCVSSSPQNVVNPAVHNITTGTPSDGQTLWNITRPLYIYFRDSDVGNVSPYGADKPFQPGGTLNWVRTLFYNPCSAGQTGCVTIGGTLYGPGGKPYYASAAGQALISAAGFVPTYVVTLNGP